MKSDVSASLLVRFSKDACMVNRTNNEASGSSSLFKVRRSDSSIVYGLVLAALNWKEGIVAAVAWGDEVRQGTTVRSVPYLPRD